eukprot:5618159-Alexandrium_andersonii.AAC.1
MPEEATTPACPTSQMAFSAARNRRKKARAPKLQCYALPARCFARYLRRPDLHCMGGSPVRRFRAAQRAVWSVGCAGTSASSGWVWGRLAKCCQRVPWTCSDFDRRSMSHPCMRPPKSGREARAMHRRPSCAGRRRAARSPPGLGSRMPQTRAPHEPRRR